MKTKLYTIILFLYCTLFCTAFTFIPNEVVDINRTITDKFNYHTQPKLFDNIDNSNEFIPTITINKKEKVVGDKSILRYNITEKEFSEFVRVVEAEVTGDNPFGVNYDDAYKSKLLVAQVILNRVESPDFPNTVHDVIFQKNAFTPLVDGRYWEVEISQVTIDACKDALLLETEDITYGCEFFSSGTKECKYGSYVFTDNVGHSFFKSYKRN